MTTDILADFSSGDINLTDVFDKDAFAQSLVLRVVTPKGSIQAYPDIGSNILSLKKDSPFLENQFYEIVADAWTSYIENGEIESFEVESSGFDQRMRMRFTIKVVARSGNLTVSNDIL